MIMLYGIYSVVINKYQCETKSEDKMEKQIDEKMTEIVYKVNDMIPVEWLFRVECGWRHLGLLR